MLPSSRTPEGDAHECPICGHRVWLEPAAYPTADAPCPHCGHLLRFTPAASDNRQRELYFRQQQSEPVYSPPEPFGVFERSYWAVCAGISALIIALHGQIFVCLAWLALMLVLGQLIMPPIYRRVHDW